MERRNKLNQYLAKFHRGDLVLLQRKIRAAPGHKLRKRYYENPFHIVKILSKNIIIAPYIPLNIIPNRFKRKGKYLEKSQMIVDANRLKQIKNPLILLGLQGDAQQLNEIAKLLANRCVRSHRVSVVSPPTLSKKNFQNDILEFIQLPQLNISQNVLKNFQLNHKRVLLLKSALDTSSILPHSDFQNKCLLFTTEKLISVTQKISPSSGPSSLCGGGRGQLGPFKPSHLNNKGGVTKNVSENHITCSAGKTEICQKHFQRRRQLNDIPDEGQLYSIASNLYHGRYDGYKKIQHSSPPSLLTQLQRRRNQGKVCASSITSQSSSLEIYDEEDIVLNALEILPDSSSSSSSNSVVSERLQTDPFYQVDIGEEDDNEVLYDSDLELVQDLADAPERVQTPPLTPPLPPSSPPPLLPVQEEEEEVMHTLRHKEIATATNSRTMMKSQNLTKIPHGSSTQSNLSTSSSQRQAGAGLINTSHSPVTRGSLNRTQKPLFSIVMDNPQLLIPPQALHRGHNRDSIPSVQLPNQDETGQSPLLSNQTGKLGAKSKIKSTSAKKKK